MPTLYPPHNEDSAPDGDDDVLSKELKDNFDAVHHLKNDGKEEAARAMALKTALAVNDEISRLRNGIAELEALLAQQQQLQDNDDIVFLSLPANIVEDDEEKEASKTGKLVRSS